MSSATVGSARKPSSERRDRDAELGAGQLEREPAQQPEQDPRLAVALLGQALDARPVDGDERELDGDEEGGRRDEQRRRPAAERQWRSLQLAIVEAVP